MERKEKTKTEKKQRWIRVCPNCGSRDVTARSMIIKRAYSNVNYCKSCGFQCPLFPEVTEEEAEKIPFRPRRFNPSQAPVFLPAERSGRYKAIRYSLLIAMIAFYMLLLLLFFG